MTELRRSLSLVEEQAAIQIPIEERQYGIRVAIITDRERPLLTKATFILAVRADMATDLLRARFPTPGQDRPRRAHRPVRQPPSARYRCQCPAGGTARDPYRADFIYFRLDRSGEFWKRCSVPAVLPSTASFRGWTWPSGPSRNNGVRHRDHRRPPFATDAGDDSDRTVIRPAPGGRRAPPAMPSPPEPSPGPSPGLAAEAVPLVATWPGP